jgi:hypothetical protein
MNREQNTRYQSLRTRRDALLASLLPDSDKRLLTNDTTRSLLAALNGKDIEIALSDAEFFIRRVEQSREQVAGFFQEDVVASRSV